MAASNNNNSNALRPYERLSGMTKAEAQIRLTPREFRKEEWKPRFGPGDPRDEMTHAELDAPDYITKIGEGPNGIEKLDKLIANRYGYSSPEVVSAATEAKNRILGGEIGGINIQADSNALPESPVDENGKPLDPEIVALARAIFKRETPGGKPIAGMSGEMPSRAQFLPATWKNLAERHLGDRNAELTPQNEREVVYKELKRLADGPYSNKEKRQLKALGQTHFNVGNIASVWNGRTPARHIYSETKNELTGANSTKGKGELKLHNGKKYYKTAAGRFQSKDGEMAPKEAKLIKFDVGAYVDAVYGFYKEFKGGMPDDMVMVRKPELGPVPSPYPTGLSKFIFTSKPLEAIPPQDKPVPPVDVLPSVAFNRGAENRGLQPQEGSLQPPY